MSFLRKIWDNRRTNRKFLWWPKFKTSLFSFLFVCFAHTKIKANFPKKKWTSSHHRKNFRRIYCKTYPLKFRTFFNGLYFCSHVNTARKVTEFIFIKKKKLSPVSQAKVLEKLFSVTYLDKLKIKMLLKYLLRFQNRLNKLPFLKILKHHMPLYLVSIDLQILEYNEEHQIHLILIQI